MGIAQNLTELLIHAQETSGIQLYVGDAYRCFLERGLEFLLTGLRICAQFLKQGDVRIDAHPLSYLSIGIQHWISLGQHQTVLPVSAARTMLVTVWVSGSGCCFPIYQGRLAVVGVESGSPAIAARLISSLPGEGAP